MIELNNAYCVAVNFKDVKADKYTTNAAPAKPLAILSAVITPIKNLILGSDMASQANNKLLLEAIKAPRNNDLIVPNFRQKNPPKNQPAIVAKTPKNFEYVAIWFMLNPFSR